MKVKLLYIAIVFSGVGLFYSCDNFFHVDDREMTNEEIMIGNDNQMDGYWAYMYHWLECGFDQVGGAGFAPACDEADLNQQGASVQLFNTGSWNSQSNPEDSYKEWYQVIRNACKYLNLTDTLVNPRFTYVEYIKDPAQYNKYRFNWKAHRLDASFFKAYAHWELWRRYGDVAIVDGVISEGEALALKRSKGTDVVNYVVRILDSIAPYFDQLELEPDATYKNGRWIESDLGRITKGAVLALKARVLLYAASPLNTSTGQYDPEMCDRAAKAAADVINMGLYSTNISYRDMQFARQYENSENILDNRTMVGINSLMEQRNYPKGGSEQYVNTGVGQYATCPSQNLVEAYETKNGKPIDPDDPYTGLDPRFYETVLYNGADFNDAKVESYVGGAAGINGANCTTTGYYLKKFVKDKVKIPSGETTPRVWYVFRYGEILLNYAEAMYYAHGATAKKGYVTNGADLSALDAVNLIRARKGVEMPALTTLTEDKLRNERRIELAFEGHRFWDVRRWKIAETTENAPLMGMRILKVGNTYSYNKIQVENRIFKPAMYRYPIPYVELTLYPSWTQNSGWSR